MTVDPFGRAIRDYYWGNQDEPLIDRDGEETREHSIEQWYLGEHEPAAWRDSWMKGPLLDMGAGAGRDALYYQDRFDTVAIDVSDHLVTTMDERGVTDARRVDMFALRDAFERDRFESAFALGTQVGLAGSMHGLRTFLANLASVTTSAATAVLDCYDPTAEKTTTLLGYRPDQTPGLAYRVMQFEYEGDLGKPLLFRLFSPDRIREATIGTEWAVGEVRRGAEPHHYRIALQKQ